MTAYIWTNSKKGFGAGKELLFQGNDNCLQVGRIDTDELGDFVNVRIIQRSVNFIQNEKGRRFVAANKNFVKLTFKQNLYQLCKPVNGE